jgi:hypothetical protein
MWGGLFSLMTHSFFPLPNACINCGADPSISVNLVARVMAPLGVILKTVPQRLAPPNAVVS